MWPPQPPVGARWRGLSPAATEPEGHGSGTAPAGSGGCARGGRAFSRRRSAAVAEALRQSGVDGAGGLLAARSDDAAVTAPSWSGRRRRGDDCRARPDAGRARCDLAKVLRVGGRCGARRPCGVRKETVQATVKEAGSAGSFRRVAAGGDDRARQQPPTRSGVVVAQPRGSTRGGRGHGGGAAPGGLPSVVLECRAGDVQWGWCASAKGLPAILLVAMAAALGCRSPRREPELHHCCTVFSGFSLGENPVQILNKRRRHQRRFLFWRRCLCKNQFGLWHCWCRRP
jgi:hypothetical protein